MTVSNTASGGAVSAGAAKRALGAGLVLLAIVGAGPALAHGTPHGDDKAPVRKEQKDWGIAGDAKASKRRIEVRMGDDMRFKPDRISVKLGETLRFVVRNDGQVLHEFVIGTKAANDKHAALMLKFSGMEHDEPHLVHVAPGKTGEIVWTFNRAGQFEFACLIAGHHQAGMVGAITVGASLKRS